MIRNPHSKFPIWNDGSQIFWFRSELWSVERESFDSDRDLGACTDFYVLIKQYKTSNY